MPIRSTGLEQPEKTYNSSEYKTVSTSIRRDTLIAKYDTKSFFSHISISLQEEKSERKVTKIFQNYFLFFM